MKRRTGFTLIELLIVVAIIAILAAIAVPNFLEAQIRSKVSRVKTDHRSIATALESYYIDNNQYPAWASTITTDPVSPCNRTISVNYGLRDAAADDSSFRVLRSFATADDPGVNPYMMMTITTPIAYMTSIPVDPFADAKGCSSGYFSDPSFTGWILYSPGPDTDNGYTDGTTVVGSPLNESCYAVYMPQLTMPSPQIIGGSASDTEDRSFTYDPSNGTVSSGDVYRVKQ